MACLPQSFDCGIYAGAEKSDVALLLRWAAGDLSDIERFAVSAWLNEMTEREAARIAGITRGGVWMARRSGLRKMRARLEKAGIRSIVEVLS